MTDNRLKTLRSALSAHEPTEVSDPDLQDSAVLLAVCERLDPVVPLVLRSDYRSEHAGEIGLPGGRTERRDADLRATALREANEEIGLAPDAVEIVGRLSDATTPTGYRIQPYVGYVSGAVSFTRDTTEVESIYLVPVTELYNGSPREKTRFDCTAIDVEGQTERTVTIRGATAGILVEFLSVMNEAF